MNPRNIQTLNEKEIYFCVSSHNPFMTFQKKLHNLAWDPVLYIVFLSKTTRQNAMKNHFDRYNYNTYTI